MKRVTVKLKIYQTFTVISDTSDLKNFVSASGINHNYGGHNIREVILKSICPLNIKNTSYDIIAQIGESTTYELIKIGVGHKNVIIGAELTSESFDKHNRPSSSTHFISFNNTAASTSTKADTAIPYTYNQIAEFLRKNGLDALVLDTEEKKKKAITKPKKKYEQKYKYDHEFLVVIKSKDDGNKEHVGTPVKYGEIDEELVIKKIDNQVIKVKLENWTISSIRISLSSFKTLNATFKDNENYQKSAIAAIEYRMEKLNNIEGNVNLLKNRKSYSIDTDNEYYDEYYYGYGGRWTNQNASSSLFDEEGPLFMERTGEPSKLYVGDQRWQKT